MSGQSLFQVLQRAIPIAADDRQALADAYAADAPQHAQCLRERDAILALKGKKVRDLNADDQDLAFRALCWAEQWESSLADSNPGKDAERRSRYNAKLFRTWRLACFGKTALEVAIENSVPVAVWPPSPQAKDLLPNAAGAANTRPKP